MTAERRRFDAHNVNRAITEMEQELEDAGILFAKFRGIQETVPGRANPTGPTTHGVGDNHRVPHPHDRGYRDKAPGKPVHEVLGGLPTHDTRDQSVIRRP